LARGREGKRGGQTEPNRVVRCRDGVACREGAGHGVGQRRQFAQVSGIGFTAAGPERDGGDTGAGALDQRLGYRDLGLDLASLGDDEGRRADIDDLAGLNPDSGDDTVILGNEGGIAQRIAGETDRPLGPHQAAPRLIGNGLLPVIGGCGGEALVAQSGEAGLLGLLMGKDVARRPLLRLGLVELEAKIGIVEHG
jgi:hypothetical protein